MVQEIDTPSAPARRLPMTELSTALMAVIGLGVAAIGVVVGVFTGNLLFAYVMLCLPIALVLLFAAFASTGSGTQPAVGKHGITLPVVALVLSFVGSVLGTVLGHVSRHLIRTQGGDGERIALAACVVGYAVLYAQVAVGLWVLTFLLQLGRAASIG